MNMTILQTRWAIALKEKNVLEREVLSNAIAAIKRAAIDKGCRDNIPDELVNEVLLKEVKIMNEMIETCPTDRVETMALYGEKLDILMKYAPRQITDPEEIKSLIWKTIGQTSVEGINRGVFMKQVMPALKAASVDMAVANKIIKELF